jgi:PAS domain S-box-containing protein
MTYVLAALLIAVGIQCAVIVALWRERTRRTVAEQILRESEERFRLMADRAPVIIWTAGPDAGLDFVNRTCVEFTGLTEEKLRGEGWLDVVHPDDRERCVGVYTPAFEARIPFLLEYRARRADGEYRWLLANGVPKYAPDGAYTGFLGCDVDITERKEAEDRIRESQAALEASHREVQHLAGRLIESQDAERARVARDLHDDVSQQLAGLSIALSGIKRRMAELHVGDELQADLRSLHQRTTTLAQNVRHLSHDLHPTVLRHAGLVAALTSYCAELTRAHGTIITCDAKGDLSSIAPEVALCLYRIAQEALRNTIAHAHAKRADVRLTRLGEDVEITVVDDGRGFDAARSLERGKGLGLVSITERVRLVGGTLRVESEPNAGTRVRAQVPARSVKKLDVSAPAPSESHEPSLVKP